MGSSLWYIIHKRRVHTKTNSCVKQDIYNWILHHPKVVMSPIENDGLKMSIGGQTKTHIVPTLLFQVSVRELSNIMESTPDTEF